MTAMMILMVFLLAVGPYHGMMGSHDAGAPGAGAPHTQMQTDQTPQPGEDRP
jgi:hypothetical protein